MTEQLINVTVVVAALCFVGLYWRRYNARQKKATEQLQKATSAGLTEPVSLHPALDPNRCISVGACADACPEGDIIGIIDGAPELVEPTRCIGHGACAAACPVDAITLVFGTERRGVEIPHVRETFETNVEGIYIAGELGGMGLIRNAVTQGKQAIEHIGKSLSGKDPSVYDVAIVGAGPAGIAASLQAEKQGLRYITLDQDDIGGTVLSYPRQKLVMTQPMELPLYGKCRFREIHKEELLEIWHDVIGKIGIEINTREKVESVSRNNGHFEVTSSKGSYAAKKLLLAIGRRGTPRKLGVPGEKSPKVAYRLIEPEQYQQKNVLVVGGGDSAIEAALAVSEQPATRVSLSYRKNVFSRIKEKNRERIENAAAAKKLNVVLESQVKEITPASVALDAMGRVEEVANDYVLVFIGGELPTAFLRSMGISVEKKFGEQ